MGESASRRRWPAGKAWAIASRAIVAVYSRPGSRSLGRLVARQVRQVEDLGRDELRGAARRDVVQPGGDQRPRPVAREAEREPRVAEDLQPLRQGRRGEAERLALGRPLVGREVARLALGAPGAGVGAAQLRAEDAEAAADRAVRGGRLSVRRPVPVGVPEHQVGVQPQRPGLEARRRPHVLRRPAPRHLVHPRDGRRGVLHPDAQHGLVHHARVHALEPVVPPAQRVLQEADGRSRSDVVRERVRPGPDEALARARQTLQQARHAVGVAVGPAADGVHGDLDGRVVLAHGAVLPVRVAALVRQPGVDPRPVGRESLLPELAPALSDGGLVRRLALPVQHARAPVQQVGRQHAAALVVDVVGVAVVGAHEGDDRLERRRAAGGQLQAVEAAPRDAGHADGAGAPRLRRDPGDDVEQVLLLLRVVLVLEHAVRLAAAAQVHAHAGVAARGPVRVDEDVARGHAVAEPVGHRLEDAGHGVGLRIHRQPHASREPRPVAQRDPDVVQLPDLAKLLVALGHVDLQLGCPPSLLGAWGGRQRPRAASAPLGRPLRGRDRVRCDDVRSTYVLAERVRSNVRALARHPSLRVGAAGPRGTAGA